MKDTSGMGAKAREGFEAEDVDSCCAPVGIGRRSEQELSSGEPFDDTHDATAEGTVPVQGRASMVG